MNQPLSFSFDLEAMKSKDYRASVNTLVMMIEGQTVDLGPELKTLDP